MNTYLIIFLLIVFFAVLDIIDIEQTIKLLSMAVIAGILIFVSGFKYETGVDWAQYIALINKAKPIDEIFSVPIKETIFFQLDPGYALLRSLIIWLGGGLQTIYFILSFFSVVFLITSLRVYSKYVLAGVLIYYSIFFFTLDMSGVRQGIAVTIFFVSLRYIYQKNIVKYVLTVLLAASFHWSAFFLIPVYFILVREYSNRNLIVLLSLEYIVFFFKIKWLRAFLELLFPFITNKQIMNKAYAYTSLSSMASEREFGLFNIFNLTFIVLVFVIMMRYRKQLTENNKFFNVFLNLFICNSFVFLCTWELTDISYRTQYYFLTSYMVLFPMIIELFKNKIERLVPYAFLVFYCFVYCKGYLIENRYAIAYHPYQNYILYNITGKQSTGRYRLHEHEKMHVKEGLIKDNK